MFSPPRGRCPIFATLIGIQTRTKECSSFGEVAQLIFIYSDSKTGYGAPES